MPKIWNYLFCSSLFYYLLDRRIRGNTIYDLFYQLVVNIRKYLPKKVRENNECRKGTRYFRGPFSFSAKALVIFADLFLFRLRHSLFSRTFKGTRYFRGPVKALVIFADLFLFRLRHSLFSPTFALFRQIFPH